MSSYERPRKIQVKMTRVSPHLFVSCRLARIEGAYSIMLRYFLGGRPLHNLIAMRMVTVNRMAIVSARAAMAHYKLSVSFASYGNGGDGGGRETENTSFINVLLLTIKNNILFSIEELF